MKDVGKVVGIIIAVLLAVAVLSGGSWIWRYMTAPIKGKVSAEEQIESAPSRIGNYDHFYDLCATIQGNLTSLRVQERLLDKTEDRERVLTNIAGLEAQVARNIARYNADARKAYTKARFLGDDLPRKISPNVENLQCETY